MSNFIIIEGVDGVGKSTVCEYLALRLELESKRKPVIVKIFSRENKLEQYVHNHPTSFYYYIIISLKTLFLIFPAKISGKEVICDRYIETVDSYVPDKDYWYNKILRFIFSPLFIRPDIYIELTSQYEVIKERLKRVYKGGEGENDDYHKKLIDNEIYIKSRQEIYKSIFEKKKEFNLRLDTSYKKPEEVVEEIINLIKVKK